MANASTAVAERPEVKSRALIIAEQLDENAVRIAEAAPGKNLPSARVIRIAKQAINKNKLLSECSAGSIVNSCIMAAADGLVCDGREAALVPYKKNVKGKDGKWTEIFEAQYIPMYRGLIKMMHRSGLVSTVEVATVYQNEYDSPDHWQYERGDGGFIKHKPILLEERGRPVLFYAVVTMRDGGRSRHVMSIADIYRAIGKAKDINPLWKTEYTHNWEEMCKKTPLRALSKTLPFESDIAAAFDDHGVNGDYEPDTDAEPGEPEIQRPRKKAGAAAAKLNPKTIDHDPETGEVIEAEPEDEEPGQPIEEDDI